MLLHPSTSIIFCKASRQMHSQWRTTFPFFFFFYGRLPRFALLCAFSFFEFRGIESRQIRSFSSFDWTFQDAGLGGHDQADDLSRDEHDSTTRRRRGRPSSGLLPYGRGNGGTGRRSKSGKHVRPAVSGWPERPEVLRVLLQARRPRQAVQVHRPEVH